VNISIHGIDEDQVKDARTLPDVLGELRGQIADQIVVTHTHFDRVALGQACDCHRIEFPEVKWLDSARVVRRTWMDLSRRGYGLAPVAERLGIEFQHHNAAEDARAAGEILLRAIEESGIPVDDWVVRQRRPITPPSRSAAPSMAREGNPDGPLAGEVIVFTGTLSLVQREAAEIAAAAGCNVGGNVTKKTSLVVVGDQDVRVLAGHTKSRKHRKAEELIAEGQEIRILRESDFETLVSFEEDDAR